MSAELIRKLKKQREFTVEVGKFSFTGRRPTDIEALEIHRESFDFAQIAMRYVIDWKGVTVDDLVGGGSTIVPEFSEELWQEWCPDHPEFWQPISLKLWDEYQKHLQAQESARKN